MRLTRTRYDPAHGIQAASSVVAETCKSVGIVKLNETCLGLRFKHASGEQMTMPLGQATLKMLWPT
jgi:hypothetical protein